VQEAWPETLGSAHLREVNSKSDGSGSSGASSTPRRVTIDNYVVIPPNNEALLMRYVEKGPVAIGICGTDPELLLYAGWSSRDDVRAMNCMSAEYCMQVAFSTQIRAAQFKTTRFYSLDTVKHFNELSTI
jgi:hypothetical protein